jgi:hypothetical protein
VEAALAGLGMQLIVAPPACGVHPPVKPEISRLGTSQAVSRGITLNMVQNE